MTRHYSSTSSCNMICKGETETDRERVGDNRGDTVVQSDTNTNNICQVDPPP